MVAAPSSTAGQRIAIRGFERFVSMSDGESMKIVHVMLVRSEGADGARQLLQHLPAAVRRTFNKYPRMRALQVRDEFATAEIQPSVSIEDVHSNKLLRLQVGGDSEHDPSGGEGGETWEQFAARECEIGFDRYAQFPFYLVVWADEQRANARLMLFSDHYMSDGYSGMVILHEILQSVAHLSTTAALESANEADETASSPLRPSMYEIWRDEWPIRTFLSKLVVKVAGPAIFRHMMSSFSAQLPVRDDQRDLTGIPPPCNSTHALFDRGQTSNLASIITQCRKERVTLGGAIVAAVVAAHARLLSRGDANEATDGLLRLSLDMDYNMRKRLPVSDPKASGKEPQPEIVGMYVAIATLQELATKGVDIHKTGFWDFARAAKRQIDDTLKHSWDMQLGTLFLDEDMHAKADGGRLLKGTKVHKCLQADVNVSNIGRYPFPEVHDMAPSSGSNDGDAHDPVSPMRLVVDSLHVYNSIPTLSPGSCVFVTCAGGALNYGIAHKYENNLARALFDGIVAISEGIGSIGDADTLADVALKLLQ
jgi:hypothetical protein